MPEEGGTLHTDLRALARRRGFERYTLWVIEDKHAIPIIMSGVDEETRRNIRIPLDDSRFHFIEVAMATGLPVAIGKGSAASRFWLRNSLVNSTGYIPESSIIVPLGNERFCFQGCIQLLTKDSDLNYRDIMEVLEYIYKHSDSLAHYMQEGFDWKILEASRLACGERDSIRHSLVKIIDESRFATVRFWVMAETLKLCATQSDGFESMLELVKEWVESGVEDSTIPGNLFVEIRKILIENLHHELAQYMEDIPEDFADRGIELAEYLPEGQREHYLDIYQETNNLRFFIHQQVNQYQPAVMALKNAALLLAKGRYDDALIRLKKSVERSAMVYKALVDFIFMLENGEVPLKKSLFVIADLGSALDYFREMAPEGVSVEIYADIEHAQGDFALILEILRTLGNNAIEELAKANVENPKLIFTIWLEKGNYLKATVQDNGRGIPDSIKEKVFSPYFTTKKDSGGTGIGLAAAKAAAKKMGGDLSLVPVEKGTCFLLEV